MENFLYGAAVQGIQGFILSTNKLREIVGASELINKICGEMFFSLVDEPMRDVKDNTGPIINAAGNIKYVFTDETMCRRVVREFPKLVQSAAPGITVSQAVVKFTDKDQFTDVVGELEIRLRQQRNKPMRSTTLGMMGTQRSRQTGLPAVESENFQDAATMAKIKHVNTIALCQKAFVEDNISHSQIAYDIEDITQKNDWIAVIHADGNGLGRVVQEVGKNPNKFRQFSRDLDKATTLAARDAYAAVKPHFDKDAVIPLRPIVLGGDDLTIVCRADLAMEYTKAFLEAFETHTAQLLGNTLSSVYGEQGLKGLTACAGIAFIKSSYPYYYGYQLAEELCSFAKKDTKRTEKEMLGLAIPQSCLMFHKVQDSFTENYRESIIPRELMPQQNISFVYGPYYLHNRDDRETIDKVLSMAHILNGKEGNALKSDLRQWLTLLHEDKNKAKQRLDRIKAIHHVPECITKERTENGKEYLPTYDVLAIHTILTQQTK